MTTIVATRHFICADRKVIDGVQTFQTTKIKKLPKTFYSKLPCVFACAGDLEEAQMFEDFLKTGNRVKLKDFEAVLINKEGIFVFGKKLYPIKIDDHHYAIGTGSQGALAYLSIGYTPQFAIQRVSKIDQNTGEDVDVVYLEEST